MSLLKLTPAEFCEATKACEKGRVFALTQPSMAEVWDNCPRADWLLWIADKICKRPDDRTLRLFAVWCARSTPLSDRRKTGDLLTDPRSLAALEVAERFADGRATNDELYAAKAAAQAAERDAARAAAQAAERYDARAAARDDAWYAARAAAQAAERYDAWAAAWDDAWDAARAAAQAAERYAARAAAQAAERYDARAAAWDVAQAAQAAHLRTLVPNPFGKEAQP